MNWVSGAGCELKIIKSRGRTDREVANWMLLAKFEGEFARGSQTYAGTGTLRYTW
jgi:hypothetical protein